MKRKLQYGKDEQIFFVLVSEKMQRQKKCFLNGRNALTQVVVLE
jgi:hypothetical protein